ncbi:MAG: ATP-binding protein [Gammaproteobacteria bacterium]|nr:ATP-binding protein [Gammaproteobacteria bacterium]
MPSSIDANTAHLRRLFFLRNIFIIIQLIAVFVAENFVHIHFNLFALSAVVTSLAVFNTVVWYRLQADTPVSNNEIFYHLLFDIIALTATLFFTGGASNPFITLFIFPIIISVTVLPARYAWLLAAITLSFYSLLMVFNVPMNMGHDHHGMNAEFNLHIVGMWLAFALSAGLVAHFVFKMGSTIRHQEEELLKARESALRDRQLIELGTLAASTAHELGTPLGTMNLLVSELKNEINSGSPQINKDLDSLKLQIDRCKEALANLSASTGAIRVSSGTVSEVRKYLQQVLDAWCDVRPDIEVLVNWQASIENGFILGDRTLTQAIMNILDNAADASPQDVEWDAQWDESRLVMEIRDRGAGLSEDLKQKLGKQPVKQKEQGMGLGLFLSHAIVERFGGKVNLYNRDGGGIVTQIVVPLIGREPA